MTHSPGLPQTQNDFFSNFPGIIASLHTRAQESELCRPEESKGRVERKKGREEEAKKKGERGKEGGKEKEQ